MHGTEPLVGIVNCCVTSRSPPCAAPSSCATTYTICGMNQLPAVKVRTSESTMCPVSGS